jgi:AmmeMemoRadiSam system protein A
LKDSQKIIIFSSRQKVAMQRSLKWRKAMHAEDEQPRQLTEIQGQSLLRLARRTIGDKLRQTGDLPGDFAGHLPRPEVPDDVELRRRRATFVTIKINDRLRGCMGSLVATDTTIRSIEKNAINAAFNDPRFPPLTAGELAAATIEVSILTEPQPLAFDGEADLLRRLTPGQDGVIIRKGAAGATFLPQVWEQLPHKEDFLTHLCLKAGLSGDAWRHAGLEVSTYGVQHFEEKTP